MEARNSSMRLLLLLVLGFLMGLFCAISDAYDFYVGGRDGWVLSPSESYNHWAERNRFQINDKIVFRYNKEEDSVLVVNEEAFNTCNTTEPIQRMEDGNSAFQFDRSGLFYFISGAPGRCEKGQKLMIAVLAARNYKKKTPPPSLAPSPSAVPSFLSSSPSPSISEPPNSAAASPVPMETGAAALSAGLVAPWVQFGIVGAAVLGGVFVV